MCTAFGLTVSEAKTEIMYPSTKGMSESIIFSVDVAGEVYDQTKEFVCTSEGTSITVSTYSSRSTGAYVTHPRTVRPTDRFP